MEWYPGKNLGMFALKSNTKGMKVGEWLEQIATLERPMTPSQRQYLYKDPYYRLVLEAITYQIEGTSLKGRSIYGDSSFLDLPISDWDTFYFYIPSIKESISIKPKAVEGIVKFWSQTGHVAEAKMAVAQLNKEVAQRIGYGVRPYVAPSNGHVLAWSNAAERWIVYSHEYKKGDEVKEVAGGLDANMIFAPYEDEFLRRIVHLLDPLPLYGASFEAKQRGQISWEEGTDLWALLQRAKELEEQERKKHK